MRKNLRHIFDQILLGPLFGQFVWGWLKMARTNHNFFALVLKQKFGLFFCESVSIFPPLRSFHSQSCCPPYRMEVWLSTFPRVGKQKNRRWIFRKMSLYCAVERARGRGKGKKIGVLFVCLFVALSCFSPFPSPSPCCACHAGCIDSRGYWIPFCGFAEFQIIKSP